ncbi:hypothetical protein PYCH_11010 [Pyrococcus yayanosii CH1]|uniref:Uncharacterized protein n=1 Tax=Pyrococcus yayanosii (strain CH1 / JCM 16557) TaxID=529709 RepID=F8AEU9_PYRYC|nr:hypothetical protein PYCH_11010 [Pyrococcus yayanosii CH1]
MIYAVESLKELIFPHFNQWVRMLRNLKKLFGPIFGSLALSPN